MLRGVWWATVHGAADLDTTEHNTAEPAAPDQRKHWSTHGARSEKGKIHPESRQGRDLVEPASLLLPWTKKIKKITRVLGAKGEMLGKRQILIP